MIKQIIIVFLVFDFIVDQYETQKICDILISLYPFLIVYCPDKYKTQNMCDQAVGDCLAVLQFIPGWFVWFAPNGVSRLKHFLLLFTQMMVYSFLMKILVMSHLTLIKNIILLQILKKFILIIILMKISLILLFISDFWIEIVN